MDYAIAKGVFDILPKDPDPEGAWRCTHLWQFVESIIHELAQEYGFSEIRTPLFEKSELFARSVGETTDIVTKEMYTFLDKGNRSLTLRPEGTAPVMRAFIEKKLYLTSPINKFYYIEPMFRYERQQAGRYRQHHQFGVEAIGYSSPLQDVEGIHLLHMLYKRVGLKDVTLHLNSIGDPKSRELYRKALLDYLSPFSAQLSEDSQSRFETNPLRILDSKDPKDIAIVKQAPSIIDFLDDESRSHFETVCSNLIKLGLPFNLNPRLVRGLDYYNKTVFEFTANELGSQNSIGGGGRYDGLIKNLGGPDLPAFGFGAGIERIIQTLLGQKAPLPIPPAPDLFLIPLGDKAEVFCFELLFKLRDLKRKVDMDLEGKKLKAALRYANAIAARYVLIIGDNELDTKEAALKEMTTGATTTVSLSSLNQLSELIRRKFYEKLDE